MKRVVKYDESYGATIMFESNNDNEIYTVAKAFSKYHKYDFGIRIVVEPVDKSQLESVADLYKVYEYTYWIRKEVEDLTKGLDGKMIYPYFGAWREDVRLGVHVCGIGYGCVAEISCSIKSSDVDKIRAAILKGFEGL